jgi:Zn-dependent M28 family amino/carboxypeptidase
LLEGKLLSEGVIKGLSIAAATYTQLKVETSLNAANSDHVPFLNAGLPAVLTIEGADSTNHTVHSANDTLNRINFPLALEILRMNAAFIATEIGKA